MLTRVWTVETLAGSKRVDLLKFKRTMNGTPLV